MLPDSLLRNILTVLEDAPPAARPLLFRAAAVFIKREECRWNTLAASCPLTEERFLNFLECPSSWDLICEALKDCDVCDGTGTVVDHPEAGEGEVMSRELPCPRCHGTGTQKESYAGDWDPMIYSKDHPASLVGSDWKETRCQKCQGQPGTGCSNCADKGWFWLNRQTGKKDLGYGNPVKFGRMNESTGARVEPSGTKFKLVDPKGRMLQGGFATRADAEKTLKRWTDIDAEVAKAKLTEGEGGAPANAAGNGGVAGIGQPEGSHFGEPPGVLGGATTKTKKKNRRPELDEAMLPSGPGPKHPSDRLLLPSEAVIHTLTHWIEDTKRYLARQEEMLAAETRELTRGALKTSVDNLKRNLAEYERDLIKAQRDFERYRTNMATGARPSGKSPMHEDTFAGAQVFDVDMDRWMASRFGKKPYHRYSRYVGSDAVGETIRQHGRTHRDDIVLKDQTTGVMTYLRRKRVGTR